MNSAIEVLPQRGLLYRARIVDNYHMKNQIQEFLENITGVKLGKEYIQKLHSNPSEIYNIIRILLLYGKGKPKFVSNINIYSKKIIDRDFQGYKSEDCLAPPSNKTSEGRLNPKNISYLYTAQDKDTAMYEVKPVIGQSISIAELKTKKDLMLLDLTKDEYVESFKLEDGIEFSSPTVIQAIAEQFQNPNYNDELKYIPTQYITEYVKEHLKLDGIKFKSSLRKDGINVVLFDTNCCDVINSKIHIADNINITFRKLDDDLREILSEYN